MERKHPLVHGDIVAEIQEMSARDQEMRKRFRETKEWDFEIDRQNTERAKEIVASIGYPTISKVGEKASRQFWLLIQHADKDLDFQKKCLFLMNSLPAGEVQQSDIAYLEDRVRANEARPLLYGTQFWTNPETENYESRPVEDPDHLDERRAAKGMETFEEYEKVMMDMYNQSKSQK